MKVVSNSASAAWQVWETALECATSCKPSVHKAFVPGSGFGLCIRVQAWTLARGLCITWAGPQSGQVLANHVMRQELQMLQHSLRVVDVDLAWSGVCHVKSAPLEVPLLRGVARCSS